MICSPVPKQTHRVFRRTHQVWHRTQRVSLPKQYSRNSALPVPIPQREFWAGQKYSPTLYSKKRLRYYIPPRCHLFALSCDVRSLKKKLHPEHWNPGPTKKGGGPEGTQEVSWGWSGSVGVGWGPAQMNGREGQVRKVWKQKSVLRDIWSLDVHCCLYRNTSVPWLHTHSRPRLPSHCGKG